MTPRLLVISIALAAATRTAHAGPYCGHTNQVTPADGTVLPVGPTVALVTEDDYYDGERRARARAGKIRATIDGKAVKFTTRDVRAADGTIRFITINSRKTGKLEIWVWDPYDNEFPSATYTIAKDWAAPEQIRVAVTRGMDRRLGVYRRTGDLVVLRADTPVIAFSLRWRRDRDDKWRTTAIPASVEGTHSEARLGQTMCGFVENVPLGFLQNGIEAELTAWLPNGKTSKVVDLPNPLVMPPLEDGERPDI